MNKSIGKNMKRYNLYMPENIKKGLDKEARKQEISVSHIVRIALKQYLRSMGNKNI